MDVGEDLSPRVKSSEHETDQSYKSNAEVKNIWLLSPVPLYTFTVRYLDPRVTLLILDMNYERFFFCFPLEIISAVLF
jgi:hypothetical protein